MSTRIRVWSSIGLVALLFPGSLAAQTQGSGLQASSQPTSNVNVVNVPTVTVANTSLQPVPVKDASREPLNLNLSGGIQDGFSSGGTQVRSLPADKRLVIQHFAVFCLSSNPGKEIVAFLRTDKEILSVLATSSSADQLNRTRSSGAGPVAALVDGGSIFVVLSRNDNVGNSDCSAMVLGYLTPLS